MPESDGATSIDCCRAALAAAGDAIWIWEPTPDRIEVLAPDAASTARVLKEHAVSFDQWLISVHHQDRGLVRAALREHLDGRVPRVRVEFRQTTGGGEWHWQQLRARASDQRGDDGRPAQVVGMLGDVNDSHKAVLALRTSQALRHSILQSAIDAVVIIDAAGGVVDFNPAAERMFDCDRDQAIGLLAATMIALPGPERRGQFVDLHVDALPGLINRRFEGLARRPLGGEIPVELSIIPISAQGRKVYTITLHDISERIEAERERDRLLQEYKALASELTLHRLAVDHHAVMSVFDGEWRILSGNDNFARTLGQPLHDLVGTDIRKVLRSGATDVSICDDLFATVSARRTWTGELSIVDASGQRRWLNSTVMPMKASGGRVTQFMLAQSDVTPLRRAEAELRTARQRELEVGTLIQQRLLVNALAPVQTGLDISCFNQASQGIDGDFVDVFPVGDSCVDLIAGDVMGKGVNAALMGAAVKMQFSRAFAELAAAAGQGSAMPPPSAIVAKVDAAMTPHLQALDAFVTLSYLRIDRLRGTVTWVGCGHEEPVIARADGRMNVLSNQQPPMGVLNGASTVQDEMVIGRGDVLLIHSDGVTDAVGADGQRVGREALHKMLAEKGRRHATAAGTLHALRRDLLQSVSLNDDLTILLARVGESEAYLDAARSLSEVARVRQFVADATAVAGVAEEAAGLFGIAVVEAFTNIVRHGVDMPDGASIGLRAQLDRGMLEIALESLGAEYEPPQTLPETRFDDFPEGGMGLMIIQRACDLVDYSHHDGVNLTRLAIEVGRR